MRGLGGLRDWLLPDAPRYCPDCGRPIEVEDVGAFDPQTGERLSRWCWHCPGVRATYGSADGWTMRQSGDHIHVYGRGRPRWHAEGDPT